MPGLVLFLVASPADRGEEYQRRRGDLRRGLDRAGELQPGHPGHRHVEQGEIEAGSALGGVAQGTEGLVPGFGLAALGPGRPQELAQDDAVGRVVVDDQDSGSRQTRLLATVGKRLVLGCLESGGEPEGRPFARLAGDAELAVHHGDELLGDRQAEPGAAEPAGDRAVGLLERCEQLGLPVGVDADARVPDLEHDLHASVQGPARADLDLDLAFVGELDRVADQVHEHLAQAVRVAAEPSRQVLGDRVDDLEALALGRVGQQFADVGDQVGQGEVDPVERQLARLDAREIQYVVDDVEQRLGGLPQNADEPPLAPAEIGPREQVGHAQDADHRGPDLVAHLGQEVRLGLTRLLGLLLGATQLRRPLLHFGFERGLVGPNLLARVGKVPGHVLDRAGQVADLVPGRDVERHIEVAQADLLGRRAQLLDRREQDRAQKDQQQRDRQGYGDDRHRGGQPGQLSACGKKARLRQDACDK